jgi:hypothetical protein
MTALLKVVLLIFYVIYIKEVKLNPKPLATKVNLENEADL